MYIGGVGSAGLHHLVWEIFDNSVDEAMNEHASEIIVTLHKTGRASPSSTTRRGIPIDMNAKLKKPALEIRVHGAARWRQIRARQLQDLRRFARRRRVGRERAFEQARGQRQARRSRVADGVQAGQGHRQAAEGRRGARHRHDVFFRPDPRFFRASNSRPTPFASARNRELSAPRPQGALQTTNTAGQKYEFLHAEGIVDYVRKLTVSAQKKAVHEPPFVINKDGDTRLEAAFPVDRATDESLRSFVNGIPTGSGGTHDNGLRSGVGQGGAQLCRHAQPDAARREHQR